eukprot:3800925-Amphidinium_carterae.1
MRQFWQIALHRFARSLLQMMMPCCCLCVWNLSWVGSSPAKPPVLIELTLGHKLEGSIGHARTIRALTEFQNQASFSPVSLRAIGVPIELTLYMTAALPFHRCAAQPNTPHDKVFCADRSPRKEILYPIPTHRARSSITD